MERRYFKFLNDMYAKSGEIHKCSWIIGSIWLFIGDTAALVCVIYLYYSVVAHNVWGA